MSEHGARKGTGRKKVVVKLNYSYRPEIVEMLEFLRQWYDTDNLETPLALLIEDKVEQIKEKMQTTGAKTLTEHCERLRNGVQP